MNIGIIGLGRLGFPVAVAIASRGHDVYGWDADAEVRAHVQSGRSPHREAGLDALLETSSVQIVPPEDVVEASEIVFIAVQTPHDGRLEGSSRLPDHRRDFDYSYLKAAVASVAAPAESRGARLTVAVISTVLPGTIDREIRPLASDGVALAYNPFFTAMGTTIPDFLDPEFVLVGVDRSPDGDGAGSELRRFYATIHGRPLFATDIRTAELVKVAYNTFIGQKLVFANAMMEICHKIGANADDLAAALALATERLLSPRYLSGGMGDGGPCHPRDNIAMSWLSRELDLSHDIFGDVIVARESQTTWLADLVAERANGLPIEVLGKAFKPESDLTAGSPALLLASILRERGVSFEHHDSRVDEVGSDVDGESPRLFFVATRHPEYRERRFPPGSVVLDPWGYIPDQDGVEVVRIGRP